MTRVARIVTFAAVVGLCVAASARAQSAASGSDSRFYVEVTGGPTFGDTSSSSLGGEAGVKVMPNVEVYLEGGRIKDAATSDIRTRAQGIATAVGATSSSTMKVNYFALGVRYHMDATPMVHPYIGGGAGIAQVNRGTQFSLNGTPVTPDSLGISVSTDLAGINKSGYFTLGLGTTVTFAQRFLADISYRYGRVSPNADVERDVALSLSRLQFGLGVSF